MNLAIARSTRRAVYLPLIDEARSKTAADLRDDVQEAAEVHNDRSVTRRHGSEIVGRLLRAMTKATRDNVYVSVNAFRQAKDLLSALPDLTPLPDVFVDNDGEIGLDWDEDRRRTLTVNISDTPLLRYSALIGPDRLFGRMAFSGDVPDTLSFMLRRLYLGRAGN
jgi:hypothetical protein